MRIQKRGVGAVVAVVLFLAVAFAEGRFRGGDPESEGLAPNAGASNQTLLRAFDEGRSDVWLESQGEVDRLLADDNKGSRHQRFIVRVAPERTVLVSHNIDLAPRIDALEAGDRVLVRGEYEWNERGGVIHWTHHDPDGRRAGGFIEHEGKRYR